MDRRVEPPRKPRAGNNNEGVDPVAPNSILRRLLIPPELGKVYDEKPPCFIEPSPVRTLTFGG